MSNFQEKVTFIWDLADLLRGVYKRNEYQKVILPLFPNRQHVKRILLRDISSDTTLVIP